MSVRIAIKELQESLPDVVDRAAQGDEEFIIERNGRECAVLVSAQAWRRRTIGQRMDKRGKSFRVSSDRQARAEKLLSKGKEQLSTAEQNELDSILAEADDVMLRRSKALDVDG